MFSLSFHRRCLLLDRFHRAQLVRLEDVWQLHEEHLHHHHRWSRPRTDSNKRGMIGRDAVCLSIILITFFGLGCASKGRKASISWYAHSSRSVHWMQLSKTSTLPYVLLWRRQVKLHCDRVVLNPPLTSWKRERPDTSIVDDEELPQSPRRTLDQARSSG